MSKIEIKQDQTGQKQLVDYWISAKGNLCWKHNNHVYVKLTSGFTMMTPEGLNNWTPADCHTKAKTQEVAAITAQPTAPLRII